MENLSRLALVLCNVEESLVKDESRVKAVVRVDYWVVAV